MNESAARTQLRVKQQAVFGRNCYEAWTFVQKNPRSGGLGFHQCRLSPKVALHWGELGCHSGQLPISLVRGVETAVYNNISVARNIFRQKKAAHVGRPLEVWLQTIGTSCVVQPGLGLVGLRKVIRIPRVGRREAVFGDRAADVEAGGALHHLGFTNQTL